MTIRTLDAGGDKPISGLTIDGESNPFLGLRGIRLSLSRPEVFRQQLRALARATHSMVRIRSTWYRLRRHDLRCHHAPVHILIEKELLERTAIAYFAFAAAPPLFMSLLLTTRPLLGLRLRRPSFAAIAMACLLAGLLLLVAGSARAADERPKLGDTVGKLKFTDTRGGTELGIKLDPSATDTAGAGIQDRQATVHLAGDLTLNYRQVRLIADIALASLQGFGHLQFANAKQ